MNTITDDTSAHHQAMPDGIQEYLNCDFSPAGAAAKHLLDQADGESKLDEIGLTGLTDTYPAHFTPQMSVWYQSYVAPLRNIALQTAITQVREKADRTKGEGFILQPRLGSIEENYLHEKFERYDYHNERHSADSDLIVKLDETIRDEEYQYNVRKAQVGSDAKIVNRKLYLGVLFFIVFGSEAAINFESFEALPWSTPAIATGATLIIGLAIGLASHYHGTVLKQYNYWFGPAEADTKRGPAWRMVGIGTAALSASLSFVYYARSAYFVAYVGSIESFGQSDSNLTSLWVIGGSLLGNIIVYLVGVLWAYLLHDADPDFAERKIKIEKAVAEANVLRTKLQNERKRDLEQLNAQYRKKSEDAKRAFTMVSSQKNLAPALMLFQKIQAKDQEALAVIQNYRNQLIQKASKKMKFLQCCDDPYAAQKTISPAEYQMVSLAFKYLEA